MNISAQVLNQLATRDKLYSLPRNFYSDNTVYQMDLEEIWYRSWVFAGHPCEIDENRPLTFRLGEYDVSIERKNDSLSAKAIKEDTVITVHCREVDGYLFISLAEVPDDFDSFAQMILPYIEPHNVADLKLVAETSIIEYGNWKLVFENNRECYHCLGNHPELIITYPEDPAITGTDTSAALPELVDSHWKKCEGSGLPSVFKIADDGTYRVARMPLLEDFTSYTMDGYDAVKKQVGDFKGVNPGALVLFHYPSTWNHFLDDQVISFRVLPIGPQASMVTTKWLVHKDAIEGVDYDKETLTYVWNQTNIQDKHLVEENQKGINSPSYEPGPYSATYESGVIQFVEWYEELLKKRLKTN